MENINFKLNLIFIYPIDSWKKIKQKQKTIKRKIEDDILV